MLELNPVVPVKQMQESLDFYVTRLGFVKVFDDAAVYVSTFRRWSRDNRRQCRSSGYEWRTSRPFIRNTKSEV